jgi:hypothetical protein
LIDIKGSKNTVSSVYAKRLKDKIDNIRKKLSECTNNALLDNKQLNKAMRGTIIPLIVDLYSEIGITADEDVI